MTTAARDVRWWRLVLAGLALLAPDTSAQQPETPGAFRFERPIVPDGRGPRRLPIDVPLLVGANPGLGDVRLFDANGREAGYLLVQKPPVEPVWTPAAILPVASIDTEKQKSSGFEADLGEAFTVDRFRIDGIAPPFLKRVRLEGSGDRAHWTLLVGEGTVFDLPDEKLRQTELAFTVGSYRYLRLTWDDTSSGRLPRPPSAIARMVSGAPPPPLLATALAVERRPSEPGRSRYRVRMPGGHLPIVALDLDVGGGHVLRNAAISEPRLSGTEAIPVVLGTGTLRRVVRGSLSASALRVAIAQPLEAQLDLVVDDGDNPPLELRGVQAIFAEQPWIYFESDGGPLVARYGNPSLAGPRYDLEAARDTLRIDSVGDARWGDARARMSEENAAGNAPPLPTVGASLDASLFEYARAIPSGDAGLIALPLDAAVLVHSAGVSGGFGDVRVIDADGRQVPYLVERASEPLSLDLKLERLAKPPKTLESRRATSGAPSVYRVAWPFERLPASRLVLTTSARVFQRSIAVGVEREPNRRVRDAWIETIATAPWIHADQDKPTPALALSLPGVGANALLVIVEEGDNTPLPLTGARVLLPAYRLRFFRDRGSALRLAYGRPDLAPPRYDLALLAPQVLGVAATEIAAAAEAPSRVHAATASLVSPFLFWGVLGVAVIALLVLIVRLLKKEQQPGTAS